MTKQEEIKQGIARFLMGEIDGEPDFLASYDWNKCLRDSNQILSYLHSQGVVVKVDKPLPLPPIVIFTTGVIKLSKEDLDKAGYVAVEPLI